MSFFRAVILLKAELKGSLIGGLLMFTINPNDIFQMVNDWSNKFFQLTVPNNLLSKCQNITFLEETVNFLSCTMLYGERSGKLIEIPYNGREINNQIEDLSNQSLWIYGDSSHPNGFDKYKKAKSYISTGKAYKCGICKGRGLIVCSACNGKGWRKDENGKIKDCSACSGGYINCYHCSGYGMVELVVEVKTEYKTITSSIKDYQGPISTKEFAKVTGLVVFNELFEYPSNMIGTLIGGFDANKDERLNSILKNYFHKTIDMRLDNQVMNKESIHHLIDELVVRLPSPSRSNIVMEYEICPVRLQMKIVTIPVYQVIYEFNSKRYSMYVYGKEKKILAKTKPSEITWKLCLFITLLGIVSLVAFSTLASFLIYLDYFQ